MNSSRRTMLLGCASGLFLVACAGDDSEGEGAGGSSAAAGESAASTSSSATSSSGVGGAGAAGAGAGGAGGGAALMCTGLTIFGSNYDEDPHEFSITQSDIEAGVDKTYTTTGQGHTHDVTLTAADFAALRAGETVRKYTCFTNPSFIDHEFVISCADPDIEPTFEGEIGTPSNCPA